MSYELKKLPMGVSVSSQNTMIHVTESLRKEMMKAMAVPRHMFTKKTPTECDVVGPLASAVVAAMGRRVLPGCILIFEEWDS
jgi:hypothetical protein